MPVPPADKTRNSMAANPPQPIEISFHPLFLLARVIVGLLAKFYFKRTYIYSLIAALGTAVFLFVIAVGLAVFILSRRN